MNVTESKSDSDRESESSHFSIVDRRVINEHLERAAVCSTCMKANVRLQKVTRPGLGESWSTVCDNEECPSPFAKTTFDTTSKSSRVYDVNRSFVLGLRLLGRGFSASEKLSSILNPPQPVYKDSWVEHTKVLEAKAKELLEEELSKAALEVKQIKKAKGLLEISQCDNLASCVVDAGVSVDGSWSARGWTARDGIMAVLSVDTGKVLDVIYLSNACTLCEQRERQLKEGKISKIDHLQWMIDHESECYLTHEGSSHVSRNKEMSV